VEAHSSIGCYNYNSSHGNQTLSPPVYSTKISMHIVIRMNRCIRLSRMLHAQQSSYSYTLVNNNHAVSCPRPIRASRHSSSNNTCTGEWSKRDNGELNDLYFSPNIVRMIKSRRIRRAGHVARMGGEERRMQSFGGET
jgi:hypothetical protein